MSLTMNQAFADTTFVPAARPARLHLRPALAEGWRRQLTEGLHARRFTSSHAAAAAIRAEEEEDD